MDEKAGYPQHFENGPFVVPNGNALRDMEKEGNPRRLEAGLLVVPDGHDAPMVVSELPQPVNGGRLPTRTGSARRENDACPINIEPLEHVGDKRESTALGTPTATAASSTREVKTAGMKRRKFWIVLICGLVLVAVIIGGAVGGTQASKKKSPEPAAASSPTSTTPSRNSTSTSTRSSSPSPTPTLQPGFTMRVWSERGYQGRSQLFYSTGGFKLSFLGRSYAWSPGKFYEKWQCSCATCFNNGDSGWRGFNPRDWPGAPANESDFGLVYINIVCEENYNDPGCPGPADASTYMSIPIIEEKSRNPTKTVNYTPGASSTESTSAVEASSTDVASSSSRSANGSSARSNAATPTPT